MEHRDFPRLSSHIILPDTAERTARLSAPLASNLATAYYEDDAIQHSPLLQAKIVRGTPSPEPSFLPRAVSISPPESDRNSRYRSRSKRGRGIPSLGDAVLVNFLGNGNRPDLAFIAGEEPLEPEPFPDISKTSVSGGTDDEMEFPLPRGASAADLAIETDPADVTKLVDEHYVDHDGHREPTEPVKVRPKIVTTPFLPLKEAPVGVDTDPVKDRPPSRVTNGTSATQGLESATNGDHVQEDNSPQQIRPSGRHDPSTHSQDTSTTTISPLRQYAIPASQASPDETLPAMQTSPPQSSKSPLGQQTLPGIHAHLRSLADVPISEGGIRANGLGIQTRQTFPGVNGASHSPPKDYCPIRAATFASPQSNTNGRYTATYPITEPSPLGVLGDASPPETFRSSQDPTTMSPPGNVGRRPFPSNRLTPQTETPLSAESQISTSSFSTVTSPNGDRMSMDGDRPILPPLSASAPLIGGGFKCDYPGCNAPPFQTQYLLK